MEKEHIALHLIKEDLKYHQLMMHLYKVHVHIEFFPDMATAVQELLRPGLTERQIEQWTNKYVKAMRKAQGISWNDNEKLDTTAEIVLEMLRP